MKTIPPPCPEPETGPKYWRSLDQLAETPAFRDWVEREFPAGASELTDPVSRRHFVKIMSASFLLAGFGLTGCRRPEEKILPFGRMPEGYVHGVAQHYATAMPTRRGAIPLLVKSHEGRPIKVEGNPEHPSRGGTDVFAQASILNLYDPDRARTCRQGGNSISRDAALDALIEAAARVKANGGQGLALLLQQANSPSRERLLSILAKALPRARFYLHEPVDLSIDQQAATVAFGKPVKPFFRLEQASVILSLDCDFIGSEENASQLIRGFAQGRRQKQAADPMNRLYAVEALMTQTGANADHRLRLPACQVASVAALLAEQLLGEPGAALIAAARRAGALDEKSAQWVAGCAADLLKPENKGKSLVLAGHRQPLAVHLAAQAINAALGNIGTTVVYHEAADFKFGTISELAAALNGNQVDTLVIAGGNPAYDAPADLAWKAAQARARSVVRLGYHEDETFATLGPDSLHLPQAHYLESWGDARSSDGTVVPIQPLIAPLFGGMTELELLARLGGIEPASPYEIARETFRALAPAGFEEAWKRFLHDGFLAHSAAKPVPVQFNYASAVQASNWVPVSPPSKAALEVVFHRDYKLDDGRYANNGWLQELPDPVTKMVWDNVVLMSQKTADELGLVVVDHEDLNLQVPRVKVSVGGREVEGPAWVQPGMADYVIGLALGYGRQQTGRVGKGTGFNAYALRTAAAPHFTAGATVTNTGRRAKLSTTQNHWTMEGRPVIREANLEQYRKKPGFVKAMNMPAPPGHPDAQGRPASMYPNPLDVPDKNGQIPRDRSPHAWGMTIDLSACVGCSACMVACQSENNIPIVGKDQVGRGREMHWIRIDRYYAGGIENPQVVNQPMLCQHCEAAPCENVCPVNATVHDEEGLNVMAYNRCVGTRYCSNNCPYKVRRFNYLDYHRRPLELLQGPVYSSPLVHSTDGEWDLKRWWKNPDKGLRPQDEWELLKLAKNPDVTVRMRGVMEKCTFCVQRIEQAKIAQKVKAGASGDIEVRDGTLQTACQQACPADAIVFGNLKDPNSRVSQLKKLDRDYSVLEFLLTKPRATYLARIRNPNPAMPDAHAMPSSLAEWAARGNTLEAHGAAHGGAAAGAHEAGTKKGAH